MKRIDTATELQGKKVFVRVDFNVPVENGIVSEAFRIEKSFKTIDYLREQGARVILASHFEGEGGSLKPIAEYLSKKYPIRFVSTYFPEIPQFNEEVDEVILLENTRMYKEEKENDETFSKHLASFADIYVNEAFPSSHRAHASIVGVPQYVDHYAGFSFMREVEELTKVLHPKHPFLFILGGAKFETKLPLIQKFFNLADFIFIGGALANDFLKANGAEVGVSLVSPNQKGIETFVGEKMIIPSDVIVLRGEERLTVSISDTESGDTIVDVGPQTIKDLVPVIQKAQFVLWNGPLGNYEKGFKDATLALAKAIGESDAESVVGGGDTVASIAELGLSASFTFISAGGGAMLDFLANETLPGIEALK